MTFAIEKGVPLVIQSKVKREYPFLEMAINDSFLIPSIDDKVQARLAVGVLGAAADLRKWRHETHGNFRIKTERQANGVRVWRTS